MKWFRAADSRLHRSRSLDSSGSTNYNFVPLALLHSTTCESKEIGTPVLDSSTDISSLSQNRKWSRIVSLATCYSRHRQCVHRRHGSFCQPLQWWTRNTLDSFLSSCTCNVSKKMPWSSANALWLCWDRFLGTRIVCDAWTWNKQSIVAV